MEQTKSQEICLQFPEAEDDTSLPELPYDNDVNTLAHSLSPNSLAAEVLNLPAPISIP
jgi:hypothetical protein